MDSLDPLAYARSLIDIDSTTGREGELGAWLARDLRARGYQVVEASNGVEALALAERAGHRIDLLVTDMVMPQMGGLDLAEKLRANRPRMRALFTSGYTEDNASQLRGIEDARFLQKPFTGSALARRVREVLGQG